MPRQPRYVLPGVPQHVIQRGNNRQPVFFDDADYRIYLEHLSEAARHHDCDVNAYVLMTNHVHLVMTPHTSGSIAGTMQSLGRRYVYYVNHRYRRSGTLWEGRYKASLIDSEHYLLTCYRYIELNPVRAGMVARPGEYRWSSYNAHAHGTCDATLTFHSQYLALGGKSAQRQAAYQALFRGHIAGDDLRSIRETLNQCGVLGSERFKDDIERRLARRVRPGQPGRPKKVSR